MLLKQKRVGNDFVKSIFRNRHNNTDRKESIFFQDGIRLKYRPHVSKALYDANKKSDRDKDLIACEN
ncbi:excalibur calcium-binding domain-containing protein [Peribacillus sp. TH16]|nr:excalibur calcium-binding domain-containing protein [Peribacillus sp. TH16]